MGEGVGDCAERGRGRAISASPLWTLQHLRLGPDQMLRRRLPTAKRTMIRAGDIKFWLDETGAIRERLSVGKGDLMFC